jgi:hypothetical protein
MRKKPLPAAEAVVPPLPLDPGDVVPGVEVAAPFVLVGLWMGAYSHFPAEAELIDVASPTVGAVQQEGQCCSLNIVALGCCYMFRSDTAPKT